MRITMKEKVRHDGEEFQEGKRYDVSPELGGYFVAVGWATGPKGETSVSRKGVVHEIQPDNSRLDNETTEAN